MKLLYINNYKMIIPVKCFTCGKVIGDKYLAYQEEVIKRKTQKINVDRLKSQDKSELERIEYLDENHMEKSIEGQVLDDFKITRICCRRHMLTHVNIF